MLKFRQVRTYITFLLFIYVVTSNDKRNIPCGDSATINIQSSMFLNPNINQAEMMLQNLKKINSKFMNLYSRVQNNYKHDDNVYLQANQILQFIKKFSIASFSIDDSIILTLGKTGWGKSTAINLIAGVKFKINQNKDIYPQDWSQLKTMIGTGQGSTTFFPLYIETSFGKVIDLPGEQQVRGVVFELINSISKKNMGEHLKKIKLLLTVPSSVFTSEGAYGSQFKKIFKSIDNFLGDINKFKENMMLVITFSQRWPNELQRVKKNIKYCLSHQDGKLKQYQQIIVHLIQKERIKLIPKPSYQDDSQQYNLPTSKPWQSHQLAQIAQQLSNLESHQCKQQQFSVPYNPNIIPILNDFLKIFVQKAKSQFQKSFTKINISGIQINYVRELLQKIRSSKQLTLQQFTKIFTTNKYFNPQNIEKLAQQIQLLNQFITQQKKQKLNYKFNWVSQKLQSQITSLIQELDRLNKIQKSNFRKSTQNQYIKVQGNSQQFTKIQQCLYQIQNLDSQLINIQKDAKNQTSNFYYDVTKKLLDRKINVPYEVYQKYIQYEQRSKIVKVQKEIQQVIDVPRQRILYRTQNQNYQVTVPKVRQVPKVVIDQIHHQGRRRYFGIAGPRDHWVQRRHRTVYFDQVYHQNQWRTRTKQVPYTQYYTVKQNRKKLIQVDELKTQAIPIQKTRKKTLYREQSIYKDQIQRVFNSEQFQQHKRKINQAIDQKQQQVKLYVQASQKSTVSYRVNFTLQNCRSEFQKKYINLLKEIVLLQHRAFIFRFPQKKLAINQAIIS